MQGFGLNGLMQELFNAIYARFGAVAIVLSARSVFFA